MLTELRIARLGVIEEATLELGPGFTAVTGETGAGKTMVVSGLGLLLGARGEARLIRRGADRALVEGRLALDEALAEAVDDVGGAVDGDEVLLTRTVAATRSRALVGGAQVPLAALASVVGERLTIHGQSEQVRLGSAERQREVLDAFAGPDLTAVLDAYRADHARHRAVAVELAELTGHARERARELAVLEFGLAEIERADPQPGEDAALRLEARRLQAVDDLRIAARTAVVALAGDAETFGDDPDALGLVAGARRALAGIVDADPAVAALAARLDEASFLLSDVAGDLASYLSGLDADPARLEWIAARLSELQSLTRRYGDTVDDVLAWARRAAGDVGRLAASDDRIAALTTAAAELQAGLETRAAQLTTLRSDAAAQLGRLVETELAALALPHARLRVEVSPLGEPGPHGADRVELLFSANPGQAPQPLARVASGGELSRVRLALEVVLAADTHGHTFVFDEVDAGVGGAVALEIGRRLARLARHAQVLVVTHLAQVAAFADRQYVVHKADDGQVTVSGVREVSDDERTLELARMMAGLGDTCAARAHAEELLAVAAHDRVGLARENGAGGDD